MPYYVPIQKTPIRMIDPVSRELVASFTASDMFRFLFTDTQTVLAQMDVFSGHDLRQKLVKEDGSTPFVEVSPTEHALLKALCSRPRMLNPALVQSDDGIAWLRSVHDAATTKPEASLEIR